MWEGDLWKCFALPAVVGLIVAVVAGGAKCYLEGSRPKLGCICVAYHRQRTSMRLDPCHGVHLEPLLRV